MITLKNISKTFKTKSGLFTALNDVSLHIKEHSIHGIIGPSGAGKSTLIRIINQLEQQDTGEVSIFEYTDVKKLNKESTRMFRKDISMIFQAFNLLDQKTVFDNIALPIRLERKLTKKDKLHINKLISLVGLDTYEKSYPSQLSGGQKQRVGIARALVNNPKILLCDEPTSALDTGTIKSILNLIKSLQGKLNLTIVLVTHDMNVIKEVCDSVTVLEKGVLVETNTIDNIIFNPKHKTTRSLLETIGLDIEGYIETNKSKRDLYVLLFNEENVQDGILSDITAKHSIRFNILYANIIPSKKGIMLVEIKNIDQEVLQTLSRKGVDVRHVSKH